MPRVSAGHREDARVARAWAAFAREDAAATAPAGLEARVLLAARAALAERRRAAEERRRHRWIAGTSALAAGHMAAAAWALAVRTPPPGPLAPAPAVAAQGASAPAARAAAPPMTNVEAGRILATPPNALLASRPLFDAADVGVIGVRQVPPARAYHAPMVEPAPYARAQTAAPARDGSEAMPPPVAVAPDDWVSREATPLFDPDTAEPVTAPAPLADQQGGAAPREVPPLPPKP
jgi:hypothetical protein